MNDDKVSDLERMRHSAAHVMAAAVSHLFENVQLDIGPATDDGFYYDFDLPHRFPGSGGINIADHNLGALAGQGVAQIRTDRQDLLAAFDRTRPRSVRFRVGSAPEWRTDSPPAWGNKRAWQRWRGFPLFPVLETS